MKAANCFSTSVVYSYTDTFYESNMILFLRNVLRDVLFLISIYQAWVTWFSHHRRKPQGFLKYLFGLVGDRLRHSLGDNFADISDLRGVGKGSN